VVPNFNIKIKVDTVFFRIYARPNSEEHFNKSYVQNLLNVFVNNYLFMIRFLGSTVLNFYLS